jgi:hypothetical protein
MLPDRLSAFTAQRAKRTHPLDESLTSSDDSWSLKPLQNSTKNDSYDQSIRHIHHNIVCCRPVERRNLQAQNSEVKNIVLVHGAWAAAPAGGAFTTTH